MSLLDTLSETRTQSTSDEQLLTMCRSGDQEAWEILIRRYQNLIYSIPIRLGISQENAREIFQETCLTLLSQLATIREPRTLAAWLIKVTMRKCMRFRRGISRLPLELNEDTIERIADPMNPHGLFAEVERTRILRESVLELAGRCKMLIERLFLTVPPEPYEIVARDLGLPKGSIGFNRMRCLSHLRQMLAEKGL